MGTIGLYLKYLFFKSVNEWINRFLALLGTGDLAFNIGFF